MSQVISNEEYAIHSTDQFESWMRDTVKSIYYANNAAMCEGYDRVFDHAKNVRFNLVKSKPRFNLVKGKPLSSIVKSKEVIDLRKKKV